MDNTNPIQVSPANMSSPMPPMSSMSHGSAGGNKSTVLVIVLAVAVLAFIFWWISRAPESEQGAVPTPIPTPADEILQEVEQLDTGNVDSEFQQIDQELDTL